MKKIRYSSTAEKEDNPKEDETTVDDKEEKREDEMSLLCSFDDFKDVRDIGTGAFARVFHGVESPSNRNVALKRINLTEIDTDSVLYASVKNEVNILKSLSHPNIVKCFYSFEEVRQSVKYVVLVLEYVNGGDLEKWLKSEDQQPPIAVAGSGYVARVHQIADAVQYIHTKLDLRTVFVLFDLGTFRPSDYNCSFRPSDCFCSFRPWDFSTFGPEANHSLATATTMTASGSFICRRYLLNDDEVSNTFDMLDMDKDGGLSRMEIAALLRTANVEPTRKELDFIFQEMDKDNSGKINKESFVSYLRCPLINQITVKELRDQFAAYDTIGSGTISRDELKKILEKTADLHNDDAIDEMFEHCDGDNDGRINFDEFLRMVRGK
uniref:Protein kinase domain-containing protein n=1 Tax=Globodera pallida TaxID=36090 RepID=A0A183CCA3_GLOPA